MWTPILEGDDRKRALDTVQAITGALRERSVEGTREYGWGANLGSGSAGMSLYFAYLHGLLGDESSASAASDLTDHAIATAQPTPGLYSGYTGVAWAAAHLSGWILDALDDEDDQLAEIDDALLTELSVQEWQGHFDVISGLVGIGVYALERRPHATADAILVRIVDHLGRMSRRVEEGRTWFTAPHLLPPHERQHFKAPFSVRNLGLAHGIPGVIALLGQIAGADTEASPRARQLLLESADWCLAQCARAEQADGFPSSLADGVDPAPARLAWCYGDLGIAAALLVAARAAGHAALEAASLVVARRAARRPMSGARVQDAGLCHGAAGIAHILNRLYHGTNDTLIRDAAIGWYRRALDLQQPGVGVAGYRSWGADRTTLSSGHLTWQDDPGFLTGAAGVGLALVGAVSEQDPQWDRVLLTAVVPAISRGGTS
jgi:lantibiotic biosynthesis protein